MTKSNQDAHPKPDSQLMQLLKRAHEAIDAIHDHCCQPSVPDVFPPDEPSPRWRRFCSDSDWLWALSSNGAKRRDCESIIYPPNDNCSEYVVTWRVGSCVVGVATKSRRLDAQLLAEQGMRERGWI